MKRISLNVNFLAAAMLAVSTEETRYYLNGVAIDNRGWMAATDGHRLFYAKVPEATSEMQNLIIPRQHIALVLKAKPTEMTLVIDDGRYTLETNKGDFPFTPIDGTFPDWPRVVACNDAEPEPAHFNPTYLADVGKVASIIRNGKVSKFDNTKFVIHQRGNNPAPVTFPDPDNSGEARMDVGMTLMPVRPAEHTYRNPISAAA